MSRDYRLLDAVEGLLRDAVDGVYENVILMAVLFRYPGLPSVRRQS